MINQRKIDDAFVN